MSIDKLGKLDKLPTATKTKDYDLKTLKAKSNALVAKSLEVLDQFMDSDAPLKDKATLGFKVLTQHIVILDKVEKIEFMKLHKSNLVLKNNILVQKSLEDNDTDGAYKRAMQIDDEPSLDLGWNFIAEGDQTLN